MSSDCITWLHLSDRHTCRPKSGVDAHEVVESLIKDLKGRQQKHKICPDLIFFTGDLAFGNLGIEDGKSLKEQFDEGAEFLDKVRKAFNPVLPKDRIFIVPGNHDVNREMSTTPLEDYLDKKAKNEDILTMIGSGGQTWLDYNRRLNEYRAFLERHGYHHMLGDIESAKRLCYAVICDIRGFKVGIGGFNTAWSCCERDDRGKLWSGGVWQSDFLLPKLNDVDLKIALLHHPHGWFCDKEGNSFWRHKIERRFHFALHGHEHDAWVRVLGYGQHVTVAAGACYDKSSSDLNGYSFGQVYPTERHGRIWLRKYNAVQGWHAEEVEHETLDDGLWPLWYLRLPRRSIEGTESTVTSPDQIVSEMAEAALLNLQRNAENIPAELAARVQAITTLNYKNKNEPPSVTPLP